MIRPPMKRDEFASYQFFQPQRVDKINRFFSGKSSKHKLPVDEVKAYRIHQYEEKLRRIYETNPVFQLFDSVGLGDIPAYILNNIINKEKIQNHLKVEEIKDKVEEEVNARMFFKSRMWAC